MTIRKTEINEKSQAVVEFSFDAAAIEAEKAKVFRKKANSFNVPGFRRGKAPRSVIEKMYGTGIFLEDAINELINANWEEIINAPGKTIVSSPEFDIVSIEDEVVMTAVMSVKPEIELADYAGIEVEAVLAPVTDEEVDGEIETVRRRNARETEVTDRAAAMGDIAVIDYEGFVDGVAFDGGKDSGHKLTLGSGQFIPGFEEGVVGHNAGEEFDVNVTFPTEYHAAELAGKVAVFKVKLNSIIFEELPALDDDFAVEVSSFDTFAEYRADVAAKIEKRHQTNADREVEEKLQNALAEKVTAVIPDAMIDREVEAMVRDGESRMQMQGLDFKTYLQYFGMDLDGYKAQVRPAAETRVKTELALEKIAELEKIEISEEDIEAEYKQISTDYNVELDYAKSALPAEEIVHTLTMRRAIDAVKDTAKVTYLDKAPEEPAEEAADAE
ncbi:MAG: trigger factor [Clostridia bacterium]|nr:trigger factor [Clostridia bacterium]